MNLTIFKAIHSKIFRTRFLKIFWGGLIVALLIVFGFGIMYYFESFGEKPVLSISTDEICLNNAQFVPHKKLIAASVCDGIKFWSLESKKVVATFNTNETNYIVNYITFSRDGKLLAAALSSTSFNPTLIKIWDIQSGQIIRTIQTNNKHIGYIQFTPNSNQLLSFNEDGLIQLRDAITGNLLWQRQLNEPSSAKVIISPDGRRIAEYDGKNVINLLNTQDGLVIDKLTKGDFFRVDGLAFSTDSKCLFSTTFDEIQVWKLGPKAELENEITCQDNIYMESIAITPDGQRVVSQGTVMAVIDLQSGTVLKKWKSYNESSVFLPLFIIAPDSKTVVTSSYKTICLWSLDPKKH